LESILLDIGLIILFAAILANLTRIARQPLILGYVLAGVFIGPHLLGIVHNLELIKTLSELGIAFLLFIVGLELDLKKLKSVGKFSVTTGIVQVLVTTTLTFFIAYYWLNPLQALYVGLAVAFSSTMVVIKLLSDQNQLDTLHGRIAIGILIIEDILAILALPLLAASNDFTLRFIIIAFAKALLLLGTTYLLAKTVLKKIIHLSAHNSELLFVTSIAVCFLFATLGSALGFSIAIGAFLAGVLIGNSNYSIEIIGKAKPLRDFFVVIFFVTLGMQIQFSSVLNNLPLFFALILLVFILKPFIFFFILKLFKCSNRTSFITSISLTQISEFSLVLALHGFLLGAITQETFDIIIILAVISITSTSYLIKYHRGIFSRFENLLLPLEKFGSKELEYLPREYTNHIVVFGVHRMGLKIVHTLKEQRKKVVAVDYNPETIKTLISEGIPSIYGDYGNLDVLHAARIGKAKMIISTIPNLQENQLLLKIVKGVDKKILVFAAARTANEALELYKAGADFVAVPEILAGQKICDYVTHLATKDIRKWGQKNFTDLKKHPSLNT